MHSVSQFFFSINFDESSKFLFIFIKERTENKCCMSQFRVQLLESEINCICILTQPFTIRLGVSYLISICIVLACKLEVNSCTKLIGILCRSYQLRHVQCLKQCLMLLLRKYQLLWQLYVTGMQHPFQPVPNVAFYTVASENHIFQIYLSQGSG